MKHLIFDFDGTIADSGPLIYANLTQYRKKCDLSWNELRDLPSKEVVRALGISKLDLPKLILQIRSDFKNKIKEQPLAADIRQAIFTLKKHGYALYIVSSNSEENISAFLTQHGLRESFSKITSFFTIFGKSHGLAKLLKEIQIPPGEAIYIGDETRDIEAAKKVGLESLAISWGYNSEKVLASYQPTYMARSPRELVELLCEEHG
jgi:phosphoglycolate phosphatase